MGLFRIFFIFLLLQVPCWAQLSSKPVTEKATFAGGCFWCTEALFQRIKGVEHLTSGYTGGTTKDPTYQTVSSGTTGHAEAVQLTFFPHVVSYEELLEIFFRTHDPTTLNRQGNDVGTQYRSAIFYHNSEQQVLAKAYIEALTQAQAYKSPIVTEIKALDTFYVAENYHQDYYEANKTQPYCAFIIAPKIEKLKKIFKDKLNSLKATEEEK